MTSALFGPDGTQPPEPDDVLSDPLSARGTVPPPVVDARAVDWLATPPSGIPMVPRPHSSAFAPLAPPSGHPVPAPLSGQPPPALAPPSGHPIPAPLSGQPHGAPLSGHRPLAPSSGRPLAAPSSGLVPARRPPPEFDPPGYPLPQRVQSRRRRRNAAKNPLIQGQRSTGTGWAGCLVVLVIFGAVFANLLVDLVGALIDLVR